MKRLLFGGLVALGLAVTASSLQAACMFEYSVQRHISYVSTGKSRCFSYSSHPNPLPCGPSCGYGGAPMWGGFAAVPAPAYGYGAYAAPVVAAPAAATPATTTPTFKAPQPAPATTNQTGVQQAGYFYYGPTNNAGYGYTPAYNYGAGYGYGAGYNYYGYGSYAQVPNYWY